MTEHRTRGDFVMVDRTAASELRRRLRASHWPVATQRLAVMSAHILLVEADYRDDGVGHVARTRTEIWALLDVTDKTAKVIREVLAYVGLLNPGGDDFDITRASYAWLTRGEPAPPSLGELQRDPAHALWLFAEAEAGVTARLTSDRARSRSGSEKSEPLRVEVGATPSRTRNHSESVSPPPAETAPKEVKKERTPPAPPDGGEAAAEVLTNLAQARPQASDAPSSLALREAVRRLIADGWHSDDVVSSILADLSPNARTGLLVTKAKALHGTEPPRQAQGRASAATASMRAAPDCKHGQPNGTWDGAGTKGEIWLRCPLCRATLRARLAAPAARDGTLRGSTRTRGEPSAGWVDSA